jgi:N-ethylmaleimide reductase
VREHRFNRATFRVRLVEGVSSQPTQARHWVEFGNITMKTHNHQKLFSPVQIGPITLAHRVVMAPLTRSRSLQPGDIPSDLMREHYTQRASDGGFIISEATSISITGRGWLGAPGLYSDEQVEGWKKITAAVHAKGCHMFSQLWHTGRSSHIETTGGETPVSASVNPADWEDASHVVSTPIGWVRPSPHRAIDIEEIPGIIEDYRKAAERAKAADFEGVELHAANGYLIDQFLQDGSNQRTDAYGGSRRTNPISALIKPRPARMILG